MRPIDAEALSEGIELHRKGTDQECESDRQWAVGYNAGLDRALYSIAYAKTIAPPPNDPLTLEELREMDGEPVWVVPLNDFDILPANYLVNAYAEQIVVDKFGAYLDFEDYGKTWLAYRRKPEERTV